MSARMVFNASITRASSPLEAIRPRGSGASPGFGENRNAHEQSPAGPSSASVASRTWKSDFLKPSGPIARAPARASSRAAFSRASRSDSARWRAACPASAICRSRRARAPSRSPCKSRRRRMSSRADSTARTSPPWRRFSSSHAFIRACSRPACSGSNTRFWARSAASAPRSASSTETEASRSASTLLAASSASKLPRIPDELRHAPEDAFLTADPGGQRPGKPDEFLRPVQPLKIPLQRFDRLRSQLQLRHLLQLAFEILDLIRRQPRLLCEPCALRLQRAPPAKGLLVFEKQAGRMPEEISSSSWAASLRSRRGSAGP